MKIFSKRAWALIVGSFILSVPAFSQVRLKGAVVDSQYHPIEGVSIELYGTSVRDTLRSSTDEKGAFSLTGLHAGSCVLYVSRVGFYSQSLSFLLVGDTAVVIALQPRAAGLADVVVTGAQRMIETKTDRTVFNVGSSITAAGGDALSALSKVPGVKTGDNGISIAGKGFVRIMLNGKLLELSGEDLLNYLRAIPANDIDKIEVITHPSARYEADGNAGLVNIVTKRSLGDGYSATVQTSYKEANRYNNFGLNGNINYNRKNLSLFGNFNLSGWTELEGFIIGIDYPNRLWRLNDSGVYKANNKSFTLGGDYKLGSKSSIGFVYTRDYAEYNGYDNVHNPIYLKSTGEVDSILRTYALYNPVAISQSVNLHYLRVLGSGGKQLSFDGDYFNYYRTDHSNFQSDVYDGGQETPSGQTLYHNTAEQNIIIYTLKGDLELPSRIADFSLGGKLSFINNYSNAYYYRLAAGSAVLDSTLSNEFTYIENTQAAYFNAEKKTGRWDFQAGLREEVQQTSGYSHILHQTTVNDYAELFPSLSVLYTPNAAGSFSLTYGKRINRPTFWMLNPYKSLLTAFSYFDGNPSLQPEYTQTLELTYNYKKILSSSAYLSYTNNGFDNVTIASADTSLVYRTPLNFLTTYKYGIVESATISPAPWWQSVNQVNAYYTSAQSHIPFIASISGFGEYVSTNNNFYFNKEQTVRGAVNFWCQFPEVDHVGRSDTYYSLDLGLMVTAMKKKLNIALNATDILKSGASSVNTRVNGLTLSWENFQLMRSFSASLTYKFGNAGVRASSRETGNESERGRVN